MSRMVVGIARFELHMSGNRSLKDKRRLVKGLVDGTRSRFPGLSMAEVDSLDAVARATVGVAYVSNDASLANSVLEKVFSHVESTGNFRPGRTEMEIVRF